MPSQRLPSGTPCRLMVFASFHDGCQAAACRRRWPPQGGQPARWFQQRFIANSRISAVANCRKLRHLVAIRPLRPTRAQGVREVGGYRCRSFGWKATGQKLAKKWYVSEETLRAYFAGHCSERGRIGLYVHKGRFTDIGMRAINFCYCAPQHARVICLNA